MATPRVTIDALPEHTTPVDGDLLLVQNDAITKKMSIATLRAIDTVTVTAHIADTSDAHDATAISATPSGTGVDGVTVQAQLGQLATLVNTDEVLVEDPPGSGLYYSPDDMSFMLAGLPAGGTTGQVLAKIAPDDYGTEWIDQTAGDAVPAGGTTSQVLAKASNTDFDTDWVDAGTPAAHATSHESGGLDPVTLTQTQVTGLTSDLASKQPLDTDLTTIAALAPADDTILQRKAGAWAASTPSTIKTDLGLNSTVTNGGGVATIRALTQAAYDALTPDATTLYVIIP